MSTESARLYRPPLQLIDEPRVIEFAQPHLHLQALRRRVAEMRVVDVGKDLVVRAARVVADHVVARIERNPQPADGLAQLDGRVRIFGEVPRFGLDRKPNAVLARQPHKLAEPIDLRIEWRSQRRSGNRDLRDPQQLRRLGDTGECGRGDIVRDRQKPIGVRRVVSRKRAKNCSGSLATSDGFRCGPSSSIQISSLSNSSSTNCAHDSSKVRSAKQWVDAETNTPSLHCGGPNCQNQIAQA